MARSGTHSMSKGQGAILKPQARPISLCAEAREMARERRTDLKSMVNGCELVFVVEMVILG